MSAKTLVQEGRMNLKPLGDRIVVKVIEELERTKGGIVLPDKIGRAHV